jgi:hypothetical protein
MGRDALTELGESLRNEFQVLLGIVEETRDVAELELDAQRLWETVVRQFEMLSAGLTSATLVDTLWDDAAPGMTDDAAPGQEPSADRRDSPVPATPPMPVAAGGSDTPPLARPASPAAHPGVSDSQATPAPEPEAVPGQPARPASPIVSFTQPALATRLAETPAAAGPGASPTPAPVPETAASSRLAAAPPITPPSVPQPPQRPVSVTLDEEVVTSDNGMIGRTRMASGPAARARDLEMSTANEDLEAEANEWAARAYKPVKSLRDLAQFLSAGLGNEEASSSIATDTGEAAPPANRRAAARETAPARHTSGLDRDQAPEWRPEPKPGEDNSGEVTISLSEQGESAAPEPDLEAILEALSQSLAEEYKRFYGS